MGDLPKTSGAHASVNSKEHSANAISFIAVTNCDSEGLGRTRMDLDENQKEILKLLGSRWKAQNLFSVEELAQFLEVSVRSIRRMHAAGAAPPRIRRSRRLMYPVSAVLEWMPEYISTDVETPAN